MTNKKTILIADDSPLMRGILTNLLKDQYNIIIAENGQDALSCILKNYNSISMVLLDLIMPCLDGFQVLAQMHKYNLMATIPVIIVTAAESEQQVTLAYDLGVSEVILKPFNPNVVKKRIKNLIQLYDQKKMLENIVAKQSASLEQQTKQLIAFNEVVIDALNTVIECRSVESGQHVRRIRGFTKIVLEFIVENCPRYNLDQNKVEMISSASTMHDIGKIAIPDSVLLKPGKLTDEEFDIMKIHTIKGCEILNRFSGLNNNEYLSYCYEICMYHHERWDGKGYPDKLRGDAIPITAQAVSIADVYDALTHNRVYKSACTSDKAAHMILNGECGSFSSEMMECFVAILPKLQSLNDEYSDEKLL